MADKPIRAAIYARISEDKEGREVGVEAQVRDCKALAERLGWHLNPDAQHVFIDNDISASRHSKKRRPAFDDLIAGVSSGEYDGILYYSNSRLTRRPREYETIIDLVEDTGVRLASVASGAADLTTADGRMIGRILAAQDAAEADRISERVSRRFKHRREVEGRPNPVRRAFGFEVGGEVVNPTEADAIRYAAKLILDGASLGEVIRQWNARGIKPLAADHWSRVTVRRILTRPRVAGLIENEGKVIGPGKFQAILDEDTWRRVCAAISDRSSMARARYKGREHLLTGLLWCGVCAGRLKVNALRYEDGTLRPDSYVVCPVQSGGCGKVKRNLAVLETFVNVWVQGRLNDVRAFDPEVDDDGEVREFARLTAEKEAIESRIVVLREQYATGDIDPQDFVPILRSLRNKIADVEAQMREFEVTGPGRLESDGMETWKNGTFDGKREVIESLISQIILHPIGKVGPKRAKEMVPQTTDIVPA
jgi:site-specific DNA recombinase